MQNSEMWGEDYAVDQRRQDRCALIQCYTLLVAEGFAGFPGNCSPSGGPS